MNDRTICRGQEIQRRVRRLRKRKTIGVASAFVALGLMIIACLGNLNGEWM